MRPWRPGTGASYAYESRLSLCLLRLYLAIPVNVALLASFVNPGGADLIQVLEARGMYLLYNTFPGWSRPGLFVSPHAVANCSRRIRPSRGLGVQGT